MAAWTEADKFSTGVQEKSNNYENIIVTHDLQDCIDDSLDKVFGQIPLINYSKYTEDTDRTENSLSDYKTGEKNTEPRYL